MPAYRCAIFGTGQSGLSALKDTARRTLLSIRQLLHSCLGIGLKNQYSRCYILIYRLLDVRHLWHASRDSRPPAHSGRAKVSQTKQNDKAHQRATRVSAI